MPAVPFASFYLSRSKALMTPETLTVRARYLEAGVAVEALNQMPDDYLGVELEFLYFLTREALTAANAGDQPTMDLRLDQRRRFVFDHFAHWVPLLANALEEATQEAAFRHLAGLIRTLPSALTESRA
jgi:TorA maturation chaperone TorD